MNNLFSKTFSSIKDGWYNAASTIGNSAKAMSYRTRYIRYFLILLATTFTMFLIGLAVAFYLCCLLYDFKDGVNVHITSINQGFSYINKKDFISIFSVLVTAFAIMSALGGTTLAFYWSRKQDRRAITSMSYELLKEWRQEKLENALSKVREYFLNKDLNEAKNNLFRASREDKDLRLAVRAILNYFEAAAMACRSDHANNSVILHYFKLAFIEYGDLFSAYIASARAESRPGKDPKLLINNDIYNEYTDLVERLLVIERKKKKA